MKTLVSKSHPKAVDSGIVELGNLLPNPILEIVDTIDTRYNQMSDSNQKLFIFQNVFSKKISSDLAATATPTTTKSSKTPPTSTTLTSTSSSATMSSAKLLVQMMGLAILFGGAKPGQSAASKHGEKRIST